MNATHPYRARTVFTALKSIRWCLALLALSWLAAPANAGFERFVEWSVASGGNGHYYALVATQNTLDISWTDAKTAAESQMHMGATGHLATLTSQAEDEFLKASFETEISSQFDPMDGVYAWIGLSDARVEGTFEWVTGEPFAYSGWAPFQPSTIVGDEDYVNVWSRAIIADSRWGWNDSRDGGGFTAKDGFFVEFDVVPEPQVVGLLAVGLGALLGVRRLKSAVQLRRD